MSENNQEASALDRLAALLVRAGYDGHTARYLLQPILDRHVVEIRNVVKSGSVFRRLERLNETNPEKFPLRATRYGALAMLQEMDDVWEAARISKDCTCKSNRNK